MPLLLVIHLFLLSLTIVLIGCSQTNPVAHKDEPSLAGEVRKEPPWEKPVDISEVSFSTKTLPPIFQIIVGGNYFDSYDSLDNSLDGRLGGLLPLREFLGENSYLPDSFWLSSPFYKPKEFFFQDFDLTKPIELGSLSPTMTLSNLAIRQTTPTVLETGPMFIPRGFDDDDRYFYDWASEKTLLFFSRPRGVVLAGIQSAQNMAQPILNLVDPDCLSVSPDTQKIAYIEKGYLTVQNLQTNKLEKWALTHNPEDRSFSSFSTEFLEWSPNGRYILGSNSSYYDYYRHKLWALDLQTGKIAGFNALNIHAFQDPIWSPDGNKAVLTELFQPYAESFRGQWILLDLRSNKINSIAKKEKINTAYDFAWGSNGELKISDNISNLIEAFDPRLNYEQRQFQASRVNKEESYLATSLRFLPTDERNGFTLDLQPALERCGLHLQDIHTFYVDFVGTPDDNYLFLQGRAATLNNVRAYSLYGRIDLATHEVSFLKPVWTDREKEPSILGERFLCSENKVLLLPEEKSILILDVSNMTFTKLLFSEPLLSAAWAGDKILYITRSGVFLTGNTPKTETLYKTKKGENILQGIKLSPDCRYLAIPRQKPYTGMLDEMTLLLIDLEALKNK